MKRKMGEVKVDIIGNTITVTKGYYKRAQDPNTNEYRELQGILIANPNCKLVKREIKKNPNKESYKGLNYSFMKQHILTHVEKDKVENAIEELEEMIYLSKCHSVRYPKIKSWFLEQYPEIELYGNKKDIDKEEVEEKNSSMQLNAPLH